MKKITDKEYKEFQKYKMDVLNGRVLTIEGLGLIIRANDYDPKAIGLDILKAYAELRPQ